MLSVLSKSDWDPDLYELARMYFGDADVTIYAANIGYKIVPPGSLGLYVGEDDGISSTAIYLDRDAGDNEVYLGVGAGINSTIYPDEYKPLVPYISVYSKKEVLSDLERLLGTSKFDFVKALSSVLDTIVSEHAFFDCLEDVYLVMEERNYYPFCIKKKIVWLN